MHKAKRRMMSHGRMGVETTPEDVRPTKRYVRIEGDMETIIEATENLEAQGYGCKWIELDPSGHATASFVRLDVRAAA